jgi:thiol-disulfide isomerase/thioredoxin
MGTSPLRLPLAVERPTLQTDADLPPGLSPGWIRRHLRYAASELEGAKITVRQSCGSINSTARMSGFHNLGLAALFALAFLAWGISSLRPLFRSISDSSIASSPAPAWKLKDLDGKLVKSSDFLGKVVILDFWATWCAPCKVEIPGFIALQKQYGEQGLVVIGVSLDNEPAVVRRFMADFGMNYRVVLGDLMLLQAFGGTAIPTTVIIDRAGDIAARHVGFTPRQTFENEIKPLL